MHVPDFRFAFNYQISWSEVVHRQFNSQSIYNDAYQSIGRNPHLFKYATFEETIAM